MTNPSPDADASGFPCAPGSTDRLYFRFVQSVAYPDLWIASSDYPTPDKAKADHDVKVGGGIVLGVDVSYVAWADKP